MIDQSLRDVVTDFQSGSREAFATLVQRYQNLVTSVAFANTGDLQRSEDIAQQAFLLAWQKQDELSDPDRFGGWIRGIANNLARNDRRLKSNVTRPSAGTLASQSEPFVAETPEQLSSRKEQSDLLWATLDKIPMEYREPLVLFYREEHSVAAVAEQMGLSQSAVKQRLKRGRAMVKREIENMVEQFLVETRPSAAFSASVMAAVPAAGSTMGATALKTGAALGAKTTAGKLTAGVSAGAIGGGLGLLGGMIGLFAGIGGAWFGTRQGMKHATSEQEVQLLRTTFVQSVALSICYTVGMLTAIFLLSGTNMTVAMVILQILFLGILGSIVFRFSQKQREFHEEFGKPECYRNAPGHAGGQPVSVAGLRANGAAMTLGAWMWLIILAAIFQSFIMLSVSIVVMSLQLVWIWVEASNYRNVAEQFRFNGKICLATGLSQFAVVMGGVLLGATNFDKSYQGVPIWTCGLFALLVSGFVAWTLFKRANIVDRKAQQS